MKESKCALTKNACALCSLQSDAGGEGATIVTAFVTVGSGRSVITAATALGAALTARGGATSTARSGASSQASKAPHHSHPKSEALNNEAQATIGNAVRANEAVPTAARTLPGARRDCSNPRRG
jgi:hypothetical protein